MSSEFLLLTQYEPAAPGPDADAGLRQLSRAHGQGADRHYYRGGDALTGGIALCQDFSGADDLAAALADPVAAIPGWTVSRHAGRRRSLDGPRAAAPAGWAAPLLMIVAFDVPARTREEVDAWYAQEHIPMLLRAPGWERACCYDGLRSQGPTHWTHIALHDLRDLDALASPERAAARSTAWRARLQHGDTWFDR
ncbi:MAG: hypothetical protein QM601_05395, partial [Pseudoxanthomonas sp.]